MSRHSWSWRVAVFFICAVVLLAFVDIDFSNPVARNENDAIRAIRDLLGAEAEHYSRFGKYTVSLTQLGPQEDGVIPQDLAAGHRSGYVLSLASSPEGFTISAVPETFGKDGSRTFFSDQTRVLRNNYSQEPANANSPAIGTPTAPAGGAAPAPAAPAPAPAN